MGYAHTTAGCACGHADELHGQGQTLDPRHPHVFCLECEMLVHVFPPAFLSHASDENAMRRFLAAHLEVDAEGDDFAEEVRRTYLRLPPSQQRRFRDDWYRFLKDSVQ